MASQSAIGQGADVVTSDSLNYKQRLFSHPDYKFEPQNSNNFGQPISLGANITPVIPNVVHNWAHTNLLFQVEIPPSAAGNPFTWVYQQSKLCWVWTDDCRHK